MLKNCLLYFLKFIPKKIYIKSGNSNSLREEIPNLKYLNIPKVVPSTLSNLSFYKCVALKFLELYKDFKLILKQIILKKEFIL